MEYWRNWDAQPSSPRERVPRVYIAWDAYLDMVTYVTSYPIEISGLGEVAVQDDGSLLVTRVFILPQSSTISKTDQTQGAADLLYQMVNAGKDPSAIRFWWHSHAGGEVHWSGRDDTTIEGWGDQNTPFLLSTVLNHDLDIRTRLDVFSPLRFSFDDMTLRIVPAPADKERSERILKDIRSNVRGSSGVLKVQQFGEAVSSGVRAVVGSSEPEDDGPDPARGPAKEGEHGNT